VPEIAPLGAQERSKQLELVARQADRHTRRAFELAGRRAYYAARAEFIVALRLLAQAMDTEYETHTYSAALAAALTGLMEADDFIPTGARLEADLDMAGILRGHRTPLLKRSDPGQVTSMQALETYLTFAQEQLAVAARHEVAGSMALHGLGKLHAAIAGEQNPAIKAAESKAMAFFQAALLVDPRNYMAANDLGVLLARAGRYDSARHVFEHRLALHRDATGWHNLAVVYGHLGLGERAAKARRLAGQATPDGGQQPEAGRGPLPFDVEWVDPSRFAGNDGPTRSGQPTTTPPSASPEHQPPPMTQPKRTANSSWWNPFKTKN
jgi:tetratricopeptide (TPR) repeat protein